jgi:uncharacterized membrane protein
MQDVPVQIIVAAFRDPNAAGNALNELQKAKKENLIDIEDAAVIVKGADGKVKITDTHDMRAGKGATIGAIAGGVLGLLAGPIGWLALGGGVIGGLAAKMSDGGFPDERLKEVADSLTPNSSALIAVIDHKWVAQVEQELARQGARVVAEQISADIAQQLQSGQDVVYTVVDTGDVVMAARATTAPAAAPAIGSSAATAPASESTSTAGSSATSAPASQPASTASADAGTEQKPPSA